MSSENPKTSRHSESSPSPDGVPVALKKIGLRVLTPFIKVEALALRPTGLDRIKRNTWLAICAGIAAVGLAGSLWIQRSEVPEPAPARWSRAWWNSPVELNAWRSLPVFENATLNAVAVLPSGRVVVGGNDGLLAYSDDRGKNWVVVPYDTSRSAFVVPGHESEILPVGSLPSVGGASPPQATPPATTTSRRSVPAGKQRAPTPKASPQTTPAQQRQPNSQSQIPSAPTNFRVEPDQSSGAGQPVQNQPLNAVPNQQSPAQQSPKQESPNQPSPKQASPDQRSQTQQSPAQQGPVPQGSTGKQQNATPPNSQPPPPKQDQPQPKKKSVAFWHWPELVPTVFAAAKPAVSQNAPAPAGTASVTPNSAAAAATVPAKETAPLKDPPDVVALGVFNLNQAANRFTALYARDGRVWSSDNEAISWIRSPGDSPSLFRGFGLPLPKTLPGAALFDPEAPDFYQIDPSRSLELTRLKFLAPIAPLHRQYARQIGDAIAIVATQGGPTWATTLLLGDAGEAFIVRQDKPGAGWNQVAELSSAQLNDLVFAPDSKTGYAVGKPGAILRSDDGGASWKPITQGAADPLASATPGLLDQYWKLPAPWVLWIFLLALGCLGIAVAITAVPGGDTLEECAKILSSPTGNVGPTPTEVVANFTVSDRPLEPDDADVLGFGAVARGVSGFLRNPKTMLPVTIAINGAWGLGKSSMMNLIDCDLATHGFRPMAFNAWHHQEDENLLASFLQAVKEDAAPSPFSFAGLNFRRRLAWQRLVRFYPRALGMLAIAALLAGAEWHYRDSVQQGRVDSLQHAISSVRKQLDNLVSSSGSEESKPAAPAQPAAAAPGTVATPSTSGPSVAPAAPAADSKAAPGQKPGTPPEKPNTPQESSSLLALLWGLLLNLYSLLDVLVRPAELVVGHGGASPLASLYVIFRVFPSALNRLRAFTENPASLLQSSSPGASKKQLEAQTSFRMRFGREFGDVTRALGDWHRLVIFIDDLDRCRPAKVAEMLEAINYIVVSGQCAVVMGLETRAVKAAVGLSFREVAEELEDAVTAKDLMGAAEQKRRSFAEHYIEKLINIEINVPTPSQVQKEELLKRARENAQRATELRRAHQITAVGKWLERVALLAFVLGLSWGLGMGIVQMAEWRAETHYTNEERLKHTTEEVRTLVFNPEPSPKAPATVPATTAAPAATGPTKPQAIATGQAATPIERPQIRSGEAPFPGALLHGWKMWFVLGGAILGLLSLLTRVPQPLAEDSDKFTKALSEWAFVAGARLITPRAIKRFLNRVRCLAMLQHPPERRQPALLRWLAPQTAADEQGQTVLDEDVLVALAAVEAYEPELLRNDETLRTFLQSEDATSLVRPGTLDETLVSRLADGRETYLKLRGGILAA